MHKHATDTENAFSETNPGRVIALGQKVPDSFDPLGLVEIHFGNGRVFGAMREDVNSAQPVSVLTRVCHYVRLLQSRNRRRSDIVAAANLGKRFLTSAAR